MSCIRCDHTMQKVGDHVWWCPRCGTLKEQTWVSLVGYLNRAKNTTWTTPTDWEHVGEVTEEIAEAIEKERLCCPECGRGVFVAKNALAGVPDDAPAVVFCRDMGHWAGYIHEAVIKEDE